MATWIVGDVQGCKRPLKRLLERVKFDWSKDVLWSCGDIVNRGPKSLKTLRYFYEHRDAIRMVLGNHDLHLLAIAHSVREPSRSDTFDAILQAPDRETLLSWLQDQPLIHRNLGITMVHAGIPPQWTVEEAEARAREVEEALQGPESGAFLETMYGNEPSVWSDDLKGMDRLRVITNYLTRMRYCYPDGRLDLQSKGPLDKPGGPADSDPALDAWFRHPNRKAADERIVFGHWASILGKTDTPNAIGLDTGCVWGYCMTLYNPETGERVTESCGR